MQPDRAGQLLKEMETKNLAPDVISYSATISACEKGTKPERAGQLLDVMQYQVVAPGVITYSATTSACEKGIRSSGVFFL